MASVATLCITDEHVPNIFTNKFSVLPFYHNVSSSGTNNLTMTISSTIDIQLTTLTLELSPLTLCLYLNDNLTPPISLTIDLLFLISHPKTKTLISTSISSLYPSTLMSLSPATLASLSLVSVLPATKTLTNGSGDLV